MKRIPTYAQEYARRGYTYALMRQYQNAITDYQETLKLAPNDPDTPLRLQYAQSMLARQNAPPPPSPTPTPAPTAMEKVFAPLNIILAVVIIGILAAVDPAGYPGETGADQQQPDKVKTPKRRNPNTQRS